MNNLPLKIGLVLSVCLFLCCINNLSHFSDLIWAILSATSLALAVMIVAAIASKEKRGG
jgi:hypothetical protein